MKHTIYLSLGSNLGERRRNLREAIKLLKQFVSINQESAIYETAPWGKVDQPPFLNQCLAGTTDLSPQQLLEQTQKIELTIGRTPSEHWGPRLIDIDILLYDQLILNTPTLTIPHLYLAERAFVLVPLAEIAPQLIHPIFKQTMQTLLQNVGTEGVTMVNNPQNLKRWEWGKRTYVMGILNITPDSFAGDGLATADQVVERAVAQAKQFEAWGVDIIDVGGESSRPNGEPVSAEMEQARVIPVIQALRQEIDLPISIDTYRAETAWLALQNGAHWINDIWGLKKDESMAHLAAAFNCPIILMHNGRNRQREAKDDQSGGYYGYFHYDDLIAEVRAELEESVDLALKAGIKRHNIILDPGIGFGKTGSQNLKLINQLDQLKSLGYPILLGTSRKGFIGHLLGGLPPQDRLEGTAATVAVGITRGADLIRVHDVREMVRVARMTDAVIRQKE